MQPTIQLLNFNLDVNNQELNSNVQNISESFGEYFGDITEDTIPLEIPAKKHNRQKKNNPHKFTRCNCSTR